MGEPACKTYTWDDYRQLPEGERWEIIGGDLFNMSPSPTTRHQEISMELAFQLRAFFDGKPCKPFAAPTDLKLSDADVVQPDLMVVCNADQVKESHVEGPPALVVEILSPSTLGHDRKRKMGLYARAGVKEVWLVTPQPPGIAEVYLLDGPTYRLEGTYSAGETLRSPGFAELEIALEPVFGPLSDEGGPVRGGKEPAGAYAADRPA